MLFPYLPRYFSFWQPLSCQVLTHLCPSVSYGILAAVHVSPELREKILQEGFYVARIHDQVFELDIPDNFQPQTY
ncbi:hypothetical protein OA58_04080 [Microcystis aeruginosa NIES-88]|nr:hypothetical protein OA58_04080 [Microcystis aeruginosa NIES-88]